MSQIFNFALKEVTTVFRDRNLILIMFITPIILSTIMGLAFGGLGDGGDSSAFTDIPIAIVNLDEGFNFGDQFPVGDGPDEQPSLNNLEFELGGETVNVGEMLLQNQNLEITDTSLEAGNASFNFGEQLTSILLAETITTTTSNTGTTNAGTTNAGTTNAGTAASAGGFNLDDLTCSLYEDAGGGENQFGFEGTLADLFNAEEVVDAETARAGVETGEYIAAVIIPAGFSNELSPRFGFASNNTDGSGSTPEDQSANLAVEIYANNGQSIKASIVQAVVEGIVNQLVRISVAIDAVFTAGFDSVANQLVAGNLDLTAINAAAFTDSFQTVDSTALEPLGCLVLPGAGNVTISRQPLDTVQEQSAFSFIMVLLGSAQAIFFALFTGIFGMNSIYEEKDNWTLQRLFAAPIPRSTILIGKMLGNMVVVAAQLTVLFLAFTIVASIVEGAPTFIWGTNVPLLATVVLGISLFVSGVGVLIVGLASTPEQVSTFGPIISAGLGALGGSFGFRLPSQVASVSPVWWGTEALKRLAAGEVDILMPLLVLFGAGTILMLVGSVLFKRRMQL